MSYMCPHTDHHQNHQIILLHGNVLLRNPEFMLMLHQHLPKHFTHTKYIPSLHMPPSTAPQQHTVPADSTKKHPGRAREALQRAQGTDLA